MLILQMLTLNLPRPLSSRTILSCAACLLAVLSTVLWLRISQAAPQAERFAAEPDQPAGKPLHSVPGEILVRFRSGSVAAKAASPSQLSLDENARRIWVQIEPLTRGSELVEGLRLARVAPEEMGPAMAALKQRDDVLYAEPNYLRRPAAVPNDPRYGGQVGRLRVRTALAPSRPGTRPREIPQ